jgi:diguanylate cyclase (GGDEF)-like protein
MNWRSLLHRLPSSLLAALLCSLAAPTAYALDPEKSFDDYVKDTWSIEEGLPQITVLAIEQDRDGYLWLGTQAGIARFDGARFVPYAPDNTPEIPGLYTYDLHEDSNNRLWIATYKGVAWYRDGEFHHVPYRGIGGDITAIDARSVIEAPDGRIIVGTTEGLFEVRDDELASIWPGEDRPALTLMQHEGDLLVGSTGSVLSISSSGTLGELPLPDNEALVNHLAFAHGRLWAGTSRGLYFHVPDNDDDNSWQRFEQSRLLAEQTIDAVFEDSDANLWIATQQGLAQLHDGDLVEFVPDAEPTAHRNIRSIFEDRERNLWLGSQWQGVARIWNGWTRRLNAQDGLHDPVIWSVARGSEGELWIGSNEGLSRYHNGEFTLAIAGNELPHPNAYTLLDDGKRLWVGTRTGLVWHRDGRSWTPDIFAPLSTTQVSGVLLDRRGVYWIASFNGLYRFREGSDDRPAELKRFDRRDGISEQRIRFLHETSDGRLLVGSQAGLYEVLDDRARRIGRDAGLEEGIDVTSITQLSDGNIVIGTLSESLFHFDGDHWHEFTHSDGLPVNSPFFLAEDDNNYLWVAGIRGLFRVPIQDFNAYSHGRIDQLRGEMILSERGDVRGAQKAFCCNGAGNAKGFLEGDTLWLPTRGGVAAVNTNGIVKNDVPPQVHVEGIHYNNQWHLAAAGGMELPADARDIRVDFTALSFQQPRSVVLRYRLRGYSDEWQNVADGMRRSATYTNLPAGNYVFEVTGTNNAAVWAPENAELHFSISPWFWETLWFRLTLVAIALLLILAGYRFQLRKLHAQRNRLERTVRKRTEELRVANNNLREAVQTDPLTGLRNRRYLENQLPADLSFYHRESLKPGGEDLVMVFAMLDLDHFKRINDAHGHHAGDSILQQVGRVLQQQVRTGDYIVRWGGEEFLVVFRPMPRLESPNIIERLRNAIQKHEFHIEGGATQRLTVSIGFVEYPLFQDGEHALAWQDMIELADHALYYIKTSGRNGWAVLRPTETTRRETLLGEVRLHMQALIDNGDLEVIAHHGSEAPS